MSRRAKTIAIALFLCAVLDAAPASAQWYVGGYLGGTYTMPARVSVRVPDAGLDVRFDRVRFTGEPLKSPQYYGARLGRVFGTARSWAVEAEFIHLKVLADVGREYATKGAAGSLAFSGDRLRMDALVQRYTMTHGLNFVVANIVRRQRLGEGDALLVSRLGVGPTIPHAESRVLDVRREQYQYAGVGVHLSVGLERRLLGRLAGLAEYKVTMARPRIDVAGGTGRTTAVTHHVAFGLAFGGPR
jgi:hypothetical protein